MKSRLAAIMILTITVLTFSGCYPTEKRVTSGNASNSDYLNDTHFEYSKDNLAVDFDFPDVADELPSKIKLREKTFDHGEMIELFFGGEAPVSEYIYGANNEYGQYAAADGAELIIEGNDISYYSGKISVMNVVEGLKAPVNYFSIMNLCKEFNRDLYSIGSDELEDFPLQNALDSVQELISKLGLAGFGAPEIYSFSLAAYEKIRSGEYYMFNEEYPLTKDDEIYVFVYPRLFGEVELSDFDGVDIKDSVNEIGTLITSSSLTVGVAKDGIFTFSVGEAYEADGEVLSTEHVKYDLDHAISVLEKYLDNAYFSDRKTVAINNSRVLYFPVERNEAGTVEFTPIWSFEGYVRDMKIESELDHVSLRDYRLIINSDVGVVREYER